MTTVLDPVDVTNEASLDDALTHIAMPPFEYALCGARLKFPDVDLGDIAADCVVCADLDRHPT